MADPTTAVASPSTIQNVATATQDVMSKIPVMVDKTLSVLADHFGATGKYLWVALCKYQFAEGVQSIVLAGICLIIAIIAFTCLYKSYFKHDLSYDTSYDSLPRHGVCYKPTRYVFSSVISAIILLISSIGFFDYLDGGIVKVVAPEGAAIQQVLEGIHQQEYEKNEQSK